MAGIALIAVAIVIKKYMKKRKKKIKGTTGKYEFMIFFNSISLFSA